MCPLFSRLPLTATLVLCVALISAVARAAAADANGLPSMRLYSFDEMGGAARGTPLGFDRFGRIAVTGPGTYLVLNDNVWENLLDPDRRGIDIDIAATDADGTTYYGTLASWGVLQPTASGRFRPVPKLAPTFPKWVRSAHFEQILFTADSIYLAGFSGIIRFDRKTGTQHFLELSGVARLMQLGGAVYVSSHTAGMYLIDPKQDQLTAVSIGPFPNLVVRHFAPLGPTSGLIASIDRRLFQVRDGITTEIEGPVQRQITGPILGLQVLPEGGFAIAVSGRGVFILDKNGAIRSEFTGPDYAGISSLACSEPGVLWALNETGVLKILYHDPFTVFGRAVGLPIDWPQVVLWNQHVVIASGGRIYEQVPNTGSNAARFQRLADEPEVGAWAVATIGDSLFLGNGSVVLEKTPDHGFSPVLQPFGTARLATTATGTCFAIGEGEIAALRKIDGRWQECAPRISGVGYPCLVHSGRDSVWLELGVNRAARLALKNGQIDLRLFEAFAWTKPSWVHVSLLGDKAILCDTGNQRMYFDEAAESFVPSPELDALFDASPKPLHRILQDSGGVYWGSHDSGILTLRPHDGRLTADLRTYDGINEQTPLLKQLPDGELWASTGHSLYRLAQSPHPRSSEASCQPILVGVRDDRTGADLRDEFAAPGPRHPLSYGRNNLTFSLFCGSYAARRSPGYRYRLNDAPWKDSHGASSLHFSDLDEGAYRLTVQAEDDSGPLGKTSTVDFIIAPPWYRTWYAYTAYPTLALLVLFGAVRISLRRSEARNAALEVQVAERTKELQSAMERLEQETKVSATLAERNRLAHEIHDSLEQGFTGLALQLEATASLPASAPEVKSGLATAISMISFSRSEVRNTLRDLHSEILDSGGLVHALEQTIKQLRLPDGFGSLSVTGRVRSLGSSVEHHLLRIAQEAITNVVKHAQAGRMEVSLLYREAEVELTVRDDGIGFKPEAVLGGQAGHFGLPSFRGRASKIGGTVEVSSGPGAGTCVRVRVPLPPAPQSLS